MSSSTLLNSSADWTWSIPNMAFSKDESGFWGPVQANHAFCEPHYAVSPYIAEFYNSLSSLIYIVCALSVKFPNDPLVHTAKWWLCAVGVGSMLFHGTMRYVFQLTDEVPMVAFLATLLIAKLSTPHSCLEKGKMKMANALVMLYSISLMASYIVLDQYEVFIHGFTIMVLVDTVVTLTLLDWKNSIQVRAYVVSLISIVLGRVAWELEHFLCARYPQVWPLHVVWHFLSCLSAYAAMVTVYVIRAHKNATLPRFWGFGDLIDDAEGLKQE